VEIKILSLLKEHACNRIVKPAAASHSSHPKGQNPFWGVFEQPNSYYFVHMTYAHSVYTQLEELSLVATQYAHRVIHGPVMPARRLHTLHLNMYDGRPSTIH